MIFDLNKNLSTRHTKSPSCSRKPKRHPKQHRLFLLLLVSSKNMNVAKDIQYSGHMVWRNPIISDLEATSLRISFHSARRWHASCWGRKAINSLLTQLQYLITTTITKMARYPQGAVVALTFWLLQNNICLIGLKDCSLVESSNLACGLLEHRPAAEAWLIPGKRSQWGKILKWICNSSKKTWKMRGLK